MDFNKFFPIKWLKEAKFGLIFKVATFGIAVLVVVLLIFAAGTFVGFRKARFSYQWGENYHQNFAGPRQGFFQDFQERDFIEPHGVVGQIIKIDPSTSGGQETTLVIKGKGDIEKAVLIKDGTAIRRFTKTIKPADLKVEDLIVVIGEPNDAGQIEAKFIRIMPPPGSTPSNSPANSFPPPLH